MLKILQVRLQQYMNCELPDIQGILIQKRQKNQRSNCQYPLDHRKSKRLRKTSTSALLTMSKSWTVWITTDSRKFWKRWEYQITWPASWETCMQVRKQQLELDIEQQTGSKQENEYIKAVYCHPAYLTYRQSTSWEMLGWMKHSWNQVCREKHHSPQICRWHHPYGRKWRNTKGPLDEREMGKWKSWLKTQHSKN